jgi:6-pyruvoyltetrahydropterin/6-carboxytetrahydropterin synthase
MHRLFVGQDQHKFSAAHMTVFPDGSKERLHGHNFRCKVTLELRDVSLASFLDVGIVKAALLAQCKEWNEHLLIAERCPQVTVVGREAGELELRVCGQRYVMPADDVIFLPVDNITIENLAVVLATRLRERLADVLRPDVVAALETEVCEAPGQGASFRLPL